jgi:RNA polymerase sigma factor (sigma-70 family)
MTSETLAQFLASLPEEERVILSLHYVKSLSPAEIAAMLNVPEGTISRLIAAGRGRLAARLNLGPSQASQLNFPLRQ